MYDFTTDQIVQIKLLVRVADQGHLIVRSKVGIELARGL